MIFQTTVKRFFKFIEYKFHKDEARPEFCSVCKSKQKFHRHSSYTRKSVFLNGRWCKCNSCKIFRYRCSHCRKKVIAVFQGFLGKYQRVQNDLIFAFLSLISKGSSVKTAYLKCFSKTEYSYRTVLKLKKKWLGYIKEHTKAFIALAIKINPTIDIAKVLTCTNFDAINKVFDSLKSVNLKFKSIKKLSLILSIHYDNQFIYLIPQNESSIEFNAVSEIFNETKNKNEE